MLFYCTYYLQKACAPGGLKKYKPIKLGGGLQKSIDPINNVYILHVPYFYILGKSPGPGIFNAWAIKAVKFAIGTHLQFVFNACISEKIFPENLELAFISPVYKKGDVKYVRTSADLNYSNVCKTL